MRAQNDTHVAQIDTNCSQVRSTQRRARQNQELWKAGQRLPLFLDVLDVSEKHDRLELVVVEVRGAERHDEVSEAEEGGISTNTYYIEDE